MSDESSDNLASAKIATRPQSQSRLPVPLPTTKKRKAKEITPSTTMTSLCDAIAQLERAQIATANNLMANRIAHSIEVINCIIQGVEFPQSALEIAIEQKMQTKLDELQDKMNAKFDQIIKTIGNAHEKSTQIPYTSQSQSQSQSQPQSLYQSNKSTWAQTAAKSSGKTGNSANSAQKFA
jgi:ABC-type Fe3+/spermidine/putrescine transport system ATPase subunit